MKMNSHESLLKKLSLIAFIMIFMALNITSYAQEESEEATTEESDETEDAPKEKSAFFDKLQWGPKVGLTMSKFYDAGNPDISEYRPGFVGGASFMYPLTNIVDLGVEFLYANQGANNIDKRLLYKTDMDFVKYDNIDVTVHTLELPVLVTIDLTTKPEPQVIPQLILGHSFGLDVLTESHIDYLLSDLNGETAEVNGSDNVSEKIQAQNFALIMGLGFEILHDRGPIIEPLSFNLDFQYKVGYSDLNNIPMPQNDNIGFTDDYNNNRLEISLKMKF